MSSRSPHSSHRRRVQSLICVLVLAFLIGCSGGGGGGVVPGVIAVSFPGFPVIVGGSLPPIFRDEIIALTFSHPVDTDIFGGLLLGGSGGAFVFNGNSSNASGGQLPYFAFLDQTAAGVAFRIFDDAAGTAHTGIIGVSADDPRVLVFDPRIPAVNPFGFAPVFGFDEKRQYDVFLPSGVGLTIGGGREIATFGSLPPVPMPQFQVMPPVATVFMTGPGFTPTSQSPLVLEVTTLSLQTSGGDPATTPIPHDDTIVVIFSEALDVASIDLQKNILIRNLDVQSTTSPSGALVPVVQVFDLSQTVFMFTPVPGFGEGPFNIEVQVGTNVDPADDLLDLPAGAMGTQTGLANSSIVTFTTLLAPGQLAGASLSEVFEDNAQQDTMSFVAAYNPAEWNRVTGPGGSPSGQLNGLFIDGSALPGVGLGVSPGMRTQFSITPTGVVPPLSFACTTPVCPFFAPFAGSGPNNFGPGVNPNGGNHLQIMYLTNNTELPQGLADSVELLEWGALSNTAFAFTFNGFRMRMSHTSADAATQSSLGLSAVYSGNFDFPNPQNSFLQPPAHPNPGNPIANQAPVPVVPLQPYVLGQFVLTGQFIPYHLLDLPFDYDDNRLSPNLVGSFVNPNLLIDIDIAPPVAQNGNLVLGTNVTTPVPVRRVSGASVGVATTEVAFTSDSVIYHGRITIAKKNSSARTLFYDLGAGINPDYTNLSLFPGIENRPPGTSITVSVQGADTLVGGEPSSGDSGVRVYIRRDGVVQADQLDLLDGRRFCRLLFEFEADLQTNAVPGVDGFLVGYAF